MTHHENLSVRGDASLRQVAAACGGRVVGNGEVHVRGLRHDSRRIECGDLFVARKGERADGLHYVDETIARGAVAVMVQRDHVPTACSVPMLVVDDIRVAIGKAASAIYGDPTRRLAVVGITGTNGKTTTSYLARAAIDGAGGRAGVLGTLGAHFQGVDLPSAHTTPEADEVMRVAATLLDRRATHLVMEVSSHALDQRRADAVRFRVAAFTNLTQDHLDYHGTLEAYAAAKRRLFTDLAPANAAIMVDDAFGEELARVTAGRCLRVSRDAAGAADVRPVGPVQIDAAGTRCDVVTPSGVVHLRSTLVGEHNLSNLLLAIGIVEALGLPIDVAAAALSTAGHVPGRLERCDGLSDDILVLVDYAHTPDALERALTTIRPLTTGRVACVFGCGGNRDRAKRPVMGSVVGRLADDAYLTNDNPRSESPQAIADAVLQGLRGGRARVVVELDRRRAIEQAILGAAAGDVVLIAGKGHEPYQIIGEQTRHFDDREEARRALALRAGRGPGRERG